MRHRSTSPLPLSVGLLVSLFVAFSAATAETVPGSSNPWLAGMPAGSTDSGSDSVPENSPVLVTSIDVSNVAAFVVSATGGVFFSGGCTDPPNAPCSPPDGNGSFGNHNVGVGGVSNGIATVRAPYDSLLGVLLDESQPDTSPAPSGLDFEQIGLQFNSLAPELKQPFFIGNGRGVAARPHWFLVPEGATRLFLGSHDGSGWLDNSGQFEVVLTPVIGPSLIVRVVYSTESVGSGPMSFGLSELPASFEATLVLSGLSTMENVTAGLGDVAAFSLGFGDGVWTELVSFSLVTDGAGEVTTLSYETAPITTATVTDAVILNSSFSATIQGTDTGSGVPVQYDYADSSQGLAVPEGTSVPAPTGWGVVAMSVLLAGGGLRVLRRRPGRGR